MVSISFFISSVWRICWHCCELTCQLLSFHLLQSIAVGILWLQFAHHCLSIIPTLFLYFFSSSSLHFQFFQKNLMLLYWLTSLWFRTMMTPFAVFPLLSRVARLVLIMPPINAGEERVFSLFKQNKTPPRSSLSNDSTLASLLQIKTWDSKNVRRMGGT